VSVKVLRLGTPRASSEGLRLGTVRRPPRGVPKNRFAADNWYDVWLPTLAPSEAVVKLGLSANTESQWAAFRKKYRAEMGKPDAARLLDLLAALSKQTNFAVGCYCENEDRCHRSVLRQLLKEHGADVAK
jgi:uncharacterized protein YeaO (DUF488 family)